MGKNEEKNLKSPAKLKIDDLLPKRPTMGDEVPVILWRLMRVFGIYQIFEEETPETVYFIGKKIGNLLEVSSVEELKAKLEEFKIGVLKIEVNTEDNFQLSIGECLTCSGINSPLKMPICQLEVGLVAGGLEKVYPGKKVIGEEKKCIGGLGDEVCLVECKII